MVIIGVMNVIDVTIFGIQLHQILKLVQTKIVNPLTGTKLE